MQTIRLTPEQAQIVADYNIGYKFVREMPSTKLDGMTEEQERKYRPKPPRERCDITDKGTGVVYIQTYGHDQLSSLLMALEQVKVTPKPLTKANRRIQENLTAGSKDEIISEKDAEIARLKAQLAAAPPKKKAGRPRKNPVPDPEPVAAA